MLEISLEQANAKATGRLYEYVSIKVEGIELTRIFIKGTEKSYYESLLGSYKKTADKPINN